MIYKKQVSCKQGSQRVNVVCDLDLTSRVFISNTASEVERVGALDKN